MKIHPLSRLPDFPHSAAAAAPIVQILAVGMTAFEELRKWTLQKFEVSFPLKTTHPV